MSVLALWPGVWDNAMLMAQAWHTGAPSPAKYLNDALNPESTRWRATRYELRDADGQVIDDVSGDLVSGMDEPTPGDVDSGVAISAAPDAKWTRFSPFESYRFSSDARTLKSGPHLLFLNLKGISEAHRRGQLRLPVDALRREEPFRTHFAGRREVREILEQRELLRKSLILFAKQYGLLGLFEEDFVNALVPPKEKTLIAPEAVIDEQGRLRQVDPTGKGKELLFQTLAARGRLSAGHIRPPDKFERDVALLMMAPPSEAMFVPRDPYLGEAERSEKQHQPVSWKAIQRRFGALLVLDENAPNGVSVLCRREPLRRWESCLRFFPSRAPSGTVELDGDGYVLLASYLEGVSPRALIGKEGQLERGWRHRSLLQAMYLMLFLDLTGGATIKKCQSRGCPGFYRTGPQRRSKYCSERCANRASTRLARGQEP